MAFIGNPASLVAWSQVDPPSIPTQAELVELWAVKQPSVSQTLQQPIEAGVVRLPC